MRSVAPGSAADPALAGAVSATGSGSSLHAATTHATIGNHGCTLRFMAVPLFARFCPADTKAQATADFGLGGREEPMRHGPAAGTLPTVTWLLTSSMRFSPAIAEA